MTSLLYLVTPVIMIKRNGIRGEAFLLLEWSVYREKNTLLF